MMTAVVFNQSIRQVEVVVALLSDCLAPGVIHEPGYSCQLHRVESCGQAGYTKRRSLAAPGYRKSVAASLATGDEPLLSL